MCVPIDLTLRELKLQIINLNNSEGTMATLLHIIFYKMTSGLDLITVSL